MYFAGKLAAVTRYRSPRTFRLLLAKGVDSDEITIATKARFAEQKPGITKVTHAISSGQHFREKLIVSERNRD